MSAVGKLTAMTIDCHDPAKLADFYKVALGLELIYSDENAVYLSHGSLRIGFQKVEDYAAPTWPTQERPQQMHFDFAVEDIDAARKELERLGARSASEQPGDDAWHVMLDPAGHTFCVTTAY